MNRKKAYVIGTRVDKSLSPLIFNHWFKKYNINAVYKHKIIKEKNFNKDIKKILKEKNLVGVNITIPFKEKAIKLLDKMDKHSRTIGAVNCITIKKKKYYGTNTDWKGFLEAYQKKRLKHKKKINKKKIILIGYGGAAKAVLYGLLQMGKYYKENTIVFNRTKRKIQFSQFSQKITHSIKKIKDHTEDSYLIINTTPRNVFSDLKIKKINKSIEVCDIVYKPKETKFLKHFTNAKTKVYGIDMLINQARPCFFSWFGIMPSEDSALKTKILKRIKG
ncbi:MAG: Shikimate dehydrogenase (NADP(+)) [Alphaproteobacteria bacterium MarineAlpha5_Bin8]|nr:MAG: Shikimate dehydrogenase (NADP(+)) [Alphaproteobacteria bacterium MarineAlpha5_Bin7]PPR48358.1 MAG: Shikimate dehydrogenase (NADP(+)) [Alphaproteobacteria bacterium MarineAlpha5_Bin8]PPR54750.1 MAG: Shikimate dehydrogenase (NADP(+)) [Alphaproteobacteria bacterium MarineAlpha5_Bin6]|tara:strand:- start:7 stop:834 length:828 start_codon:yes stop_codon:yes gene_type:complete